MSNFVMANAKIENSSPAPVHRCPFTDMSNDTILNILKFVRPWDILSARQTCRRLSIVTTNRALWVNTLKALMKEHFVTEETFPLGSMSLESLEHAALIPHKFVSLLKSSTGTMLEPAVVRILPSRLTVREQNLYGVLNNGKIVCFCIVPGGRYLIVKTEHKPKEGQSMTALFTLWDIGSSQSQHPRALARMVIPANHRTEEFRLQGLASDPRTDHQGVLYMICCGDNLNNSKAYARVYKIVIFSQSPEFKLYAKQSLPANYDCISVSRQLHRLIFHYIKSGKHVFMLWEYVENRWASWIASDYPSDKDSDPIFFSFKDAVVATSDSKDMAIYNIPELVEGNPHPPKPTNANLIIKNPLSGKSAYIPDSAPYTELRPYICISNKKKVVIQQVKNLNLVSDINIPKKLPVVCGTIDISGLNFGRLDFLDNLNKDHLILGYISEDWHNCSLVVIDIDSSGKPITSGSDLKGKATKIGYGGDNTGMQMLEICSLTGRIFMITEGPTPQLHILDYLRSPE